MFRLYFLTSVADVVASVILNYQLIQNSLEFENLIFWRTRPTENSPRARFLHLGLVSQINPYKTRSLICVLFFYACNSAIIGE
jgi:hypothetical protein